MAQMNLLQNRKRFTATENRLGLPRLGSGMDGELGVRRCKLLHLEGMSNEVLLYSRGNYIQSPVTDREAGDRRRGGRYIHV